MVLWVAILALSTLLYVLLDGFDLGVGILFAFTRDEVDRRRMLSAISPVWDGNETWLVVAGTVLFGAFPKAFAALLSAFYLPIVLMLGALILRGVAFEFRYKTTRFRWVWNFSFAAGSLLATFVQGIVIGALVKGMPIVEGHYVGDSLSWLSPFACLCGIGLRLMSRWLERPYLLIFPLIGAVATHRLVRSILHHDDFQPFRMVCLVFVAAFATLAVSFWPYMIPFSLTVEDALAPESSLRFIFWPGVIVLPLICAYTAIVYWLFRGKIRDEADEGPTPVLVDSSLNHLESGGS